jgi:hypothetical protein
MSKKALVLSSWLSNIRSNGAFLSRNSVDVIDVIGFIWNKDYNTFKYVHAQRPFHERTGTSGSNHEKFVQPTLLQGDKS